MIMVLLEKISPLGQTRNARRSPERISKLSKDSLSARDLLTISINPIIIDSWNALLSRHYRAHSQRRRLSRGQ